MSQSVYIISATTMYTIIPFPFREHNYTYQTQLKTLAHIIYMYVYVCLYIHTYIYIYIYDIYIYIHPSNGVSTLAQMLQHGLLNHSGLQMGAPALIFRGSDPRIKAISSYACGRLRCQATRPMAVGKKASLAVLEASIQPRTGREATTTRETSMGIAYEGQKTRSFWILERIHKPITCCHKRELSSKIPDSPAALAWRRHGMRRAVQRMAKRAGEGRTSIPCCSVEHILKVLTSMT